MWVASRRSTHYSQRNLKGFVSKTHFLRWVCVQSPRSRDGFFFDFFLTRYEFLLWRKLRIWCFRTRHVRFRTRFVSLTLIYLCCLSQYHDGLRWSPSNIDLIFERFRARHVSVFKGRCQIQKLLKIQRSTDHGMADLGHRGIGQPCVPCVPSKGAHGGLGI